MRGEVEALAQGIVEWQQALARRATPPASSATARFADDVAKTNLAAILEQHGIANVRSL
jgi:adenine-specific DNA-methyltransferase